MLRIRPRGLWPAMLCLGGLVGCEDGATTPKTLPSAFPTAEGTTWTYAYADANYGDSFEWTVERRIGDTVVLDRPSLGTHPGPVTLRILDDGLDLISDDAGAAPLYRFTPGVEWMRRDPWECDDDSRWTVFEEEDPVITPAGHFTGTLRLERRSSANCTDAGTMQEWWAPGIGVIMWEELNFFAGGPVVVWLVDVEPG